MLTEWLYWLQSIPRAELLQVLIVLILVDAPRYALCCTSIVLFDLVRDVARALVPSWRKKPVWDPHTPSVCVLIAGHNEASTIESTVGSLWGTYPRMEVIVIDDGSTDGMAEAAQRFAHTHEGVRVLSRNERGGKSSALNWGLSYTKAEIVVSVDADSHLMPNAIWEIVQPFVDPDVGAVSATLRAWNPFANLATWMQAYEYRQSIFLGRMIEARLNVLAIVSGAFGAFRRDILKDQLQGWDVGPGEDGDLTLKIRKSKRRIAVAPKAVCLTNVPTKWTGLFRQRLRWDRSIITLSRKHFRMAFLTGKRVTASDWWLLLDQWFFNVICPYMFWAWVIQTAVSYVADPMASINTFYLLFLLYLCQLGLEVLQVLALFFYTKTPRQDLIICSMLPFAPLYRIFLKAATATAITQELLFRKSYRDNFVPKRVREATWHW